MVRLVLGLMCLLAMAAAALARPQPTIEITLETKEAFLGDTVVIEVRWMGLADPPDLSALERDADRVRETAGTRLAVIDGQVIDVSSRRIELRPRALGLLTLGPVEADGVKSNSVSIEITEPKSIAWTPGPEDVQLVQRVSEFAPWLQQQITLDIELRTRFPMLDQAINLPNFDGFRVLPLVTARRTLDETDGWAKTSWRYLLFPQRSGKQTLSGASISGTLLKSRAERGNFTLSAPDTVLEVKPSAFGDGRWWLAGSSLAIGDDWSVEPTTLTAGDEVDRIISVNATGILAEQIPDLVMGETRGLVITPLDIQRESKVVNDVSQASARFKFRIRVLTPGSVFLDTIRLRWWSVPGNRPVDTIIPARRIEIATPDRDALASRAAAEQSWFERMQLWSSGLPVHWLAVAGAALFLAAFLALRPVRQWIARELVLGSTRRLMHTHAAAGDAAALNETLRSLGRSRPRLKPTLLDQRQKLESGLAAGSRVDLRTVVRQTITALRADLKGATPTRLPEL